MHVNRNYRGKNGCGEKNGVINFDYFEADLIKTVVI